MTRKKLLQVVARRLSLLALLYGGEDLEKLSRVIRTYGVLYKNSGLMLLDTPQWFDTQNDLLRQRVEEHLPGIRYCFAHSTYHDIQGGSLLSVSEQQRLSEGQNAVRRGFVENKPYNTRDFVYGLLLPESMADFTLLDKFDNQNKPLKTHVIPLHALLECVGDVASKPISPSMYQPNPQILHDREILPGVYYRLIVSRENNCNFIQFQLYSLSKSKNFTITEHEHYAHGRDILKRQVDLVVRFSEILLEFAPKAGRDFLKPLLEKSHPKEEVFACLLEIISWFPVPELTIPLDIPLEKLSSVTKILTYPDHSVLSRFHNLVVEDKTDELRCHVNNYLQVGNGVGETKAEEALPEDSMLNIKLRSLSWRLGNKPKFLHLNLLHLAIFSGARKNVDYLMQCYPFLSCQTIYTSTYLAVGGLYVTEMTSKHLAAGKKRPFILDRLRQHDPRKILAKGRTPELFLNRKTIDPFYKNASYHVNGSAFFQVNLIRLLANLLLETESLSACQVSYYLHWHAGIDVLRFTLHITPNAHDIGVHQAQAPILWNVLKEENQNKDSMRVQLMSHVLHLDVSSQQGRLIAIIEQLFIREIYTILLCAQNTDYWLANAKYHPKSGEGATESSVLLQKPLPLDHDYLLGIKLLADFSIQLMVEAGYEETLLTVMHRAWRIPLDKMKLDKGSVYLKAHVVDLITRAHRYRSNYQGCLLVNAQGQLALAERKIAEKSLGYSSAGGHNNDPYAMPPWTLGDHPLDQDAVYPSVGVVKGLEDEFGMVIHPQHMSQLKRLGKVDHNEFWLYQGEYTLTPKADEFCKEHNLPFMAENDEFDPLTAKFSSLLQLSKQPGLQWRKVGMLDCLIDYTIRETNRLLKRYCNDISVEREHDTDHFRVIGPVVAHMRFKAESEQGILRIDELRKLLGLAVYDEYMFAKQLKTTRVVRLCVRDCFDFMKKLSELAQLSDSHKLLNAELDTVYRNKITLLKKKLRPELSALKYKVVPVYQTLVGFSTYIIEVTGSVRAIFSLLSYYNFGRWKVGVAKCLSYDPSIGLCFKFPERPVIFCEQVMSGIPYRKKVGIGNAKAIFSSVIKQLRLYIERMDVLPVNASNQDVINDMIQHISDCWGWFSVQREPCVGDVERAVSIYKNYCEGLSLFLLLDQKCKQAELKAYSDIEAFRLNIIYALFSINPFYGEDEDVLIPEWRHMPEYVDIIRASMDVLKQILFTLCCRYNRQTYESVQLTILGILNLGNVRKSLSYETNLNNVSNVKKILACIGVVFSGGEFPEERAFLQNEFGNRLDIDKIAPKKTGSNFGKKTFLERSYHLYRACDDRAMSFFTQQSAIRTIFHAFLIYSSVYSSPDCEKPTTNQTLCFFTIVLLWLFVAHVYKQKSASLEKKSSANAPLSEKLTPLMRAIKEGDLNEISKLLKAGAPIFFEDVDRQSSIRLLLHASSEVITTVMKILLLKAIIASDKDFLSSDFYHAQAYLQGKVTWKEDEVYNSPIPGASRSAISIAMAEDNQQAIKFLSTKVELRFLLIKTHSWPWGIVPT